MSKSAGNFYTLKDLVDKGYDKRAIRYELLKTHYRVKLDFREDELKKIPETLSKFDELIHKLKNIKSTHEFSDKNLSDNALKNFEDEMDDDLNISGALSKVFEFIKEINKLIDEGNINKINADKYIETLKKIDSVLGIMNFEVENIPDNIIQLAEDRLKARFEKNWAESDKLRDEINSKGYQILDEKTTYRLKKI
jgi:cysteinyl-tRNA synthetase